ncbi:hypothetical protein CAPTEDRAFT_226456 [Capitella teleta]|uniref:SH3 domain-containing protein n=1 Tax=Capitella teleta TaxID=283909 RepID=R7V5Q3_CAPTE|nr:hypothetical protein CAPTEDRAFT_226456 [Capitella teleta]|eukprot:ELU11115.1 hypothetical protein CAPTEDRAFT_226456 [Capitella teleta]
MAKFGDKIRGILFALIHISDVERFLKVTLKDVKLQAEGNEAKDKIMNDINNLRDEWTQMNPDPEDRKKLDSEISKGMTKAKSELNLADISKAIPASEMKDFDQTGYLVRKPVVDGSRNPMKVLRQALKNNRFLCFLKDDMIYCYEKETSKKASGIYDIHDYECRSTCKEEGSKKEYSFQLTKAASKSYVFAASSLDECNSWVLAISGNPDNLYYEDVPTQSITTASVPKAAAAAAAAKDEEEADEEGGDLYEDPDELKPKVSDSEELYSDADGDADEDVEEGELYQDAESPQEAPTKVQDEESDKEIYDDTAEDIYETYDDVAPETVKPLQAKAVSPPVAEPGNYFERLYYCVYDLHGDDDDELSCCYGDVIEILSKSHCGMNWWVAKYDDRIGIVPKDYLSPVYGTVN